MKERGDTIRFGDFKLDRTSQELRLAGKRVALQPQAMRVLLCLIECSGAIVPRDELQRAVWGTDTFVDFDQGLNWCVRRIREVLGDDAREPRYVETIPRRGYRFIAATTIERAASAASRVRWCIAVAGVALISLLGAVRSATEVRPVTVVVLPFDNLSGERANDTIADLLTENVINHVGAARADRLRVIDPLTAKKFKRTGECIIHIGKELGAQFVVEGSFQPSGRITAALYRVSDNTQVWATAVPPRTSAPWAIVGDRIVATLWPPSSRPD